MQGAPYNVDSFTGKPDQITSDEYDFEARELHNGQGRWISPDPTSGTGNKYVYADNNPLSKVDIYGYFSMFLNGMDMGDNGEDIEAVTNHPESHPAERPDRQRHRIDSERRHRVISCPGAAATGTAAPAAATITSRPG